MMDMHDRVSPECAPEALVCRPQPPGLSGAPANQYHFHYNPFHYIIKLYIKNTATENLGGRLERGRGGAR